MLLSVLVLMTACGGSMGDDTSGPQVGTPI